MILRKHKLIDENRKLEITSINRINRREYCSINNKNFKIKIINLKDNYPKLYKLVFNGKLTVKECYKIISIIRRYKNYV